MSTLTLRPTSDDTKEQSLSSGSDAYALVDEVSLSTSDYCQGTSTYKLNLYGLSNHTTEEGVVSSITVYGVIAKQSALFTGKYKMAIKVGSTVYYGSEGSASTDPEVKSETWSTNPATGVAWTWSDIDSLIAGCSLNGGSGWERNYQLYVVVTYITIPTITTQACSLVKTTTATFNGTITATPDAYVTQRGFVYMIGTSGDPTIGGAGCTDVHEHAWGVGWGVGTFYRNVLGLIENTDYRVRAYAINTGGTGYGTTVDMKTIGAGFFLVF